MMFDVFLRWAQLSGLRSRRLPPSHRTDFHATLIQEKCSHVQSISYGLFGRRQLCSLIEFEIESGAQRKTSHHDNVHLTNSPTRSFIFKPPINELLIINPFTFFIFYRAFTKLWFNVSGMIQTILQWLKKYTNL